METYAEAHGQSFDWYTFLTTVKIEDLARLAEADSYASGWCGCAVGNLPVEIERQPSGAPMNWDLVDLGAQFGGQVGSMYHWAIHAKKGGVFRQHFESTRLTSLNLLAKIQTRGFEILAKTHPERLPLAG